MDPLTTITLLGIAKEMPAFQTFFTNLFFPNVILSPTREIMFDKVIKNKKMAPLVSPMTSGVANTQDAVQALTFSPPYVKSTDVVTSDRLLKRRPGEGIGGELSPVDRRLAIIADMLGEHEEQIKRRIEWLCAQLLINGKIVCTIEGQGEVELDFKRRAENTITLTGAARWSELDKENSRQPLDDIEEWSALSTQMVDIVVMDKESYAEFIQFKSVKELLETRRGSAATAEIAISTEKVAAWRAELGSVQIYVHKGTVDDKDNADVPLMPAGGVLLGVTGIDGTLSYGAIQDAKANANGVVAAERYPSNWYTDNPSVEWLQTQAAPLPVMPDINAFVFATVL